MFRLAEERDLPAIQAFLAPRVATSMFLSGNLRDHGLGDDHSKSMTVWLVEDEGEITNVIGYATAGFLVFEAPDLSAEMARNLRANLNGRPLRGVNGAEGQMSAVVAALDLPLEKAVMDEVEPHYQLDLSRLTVPEGESQLRAAREADLPMLAEWRMASEIEILGARDTDENRQLALAALKELLPAGRLRVLEVDSQPVAMTNFNAALPTIVQVGGVYTPPDLRGLGHARRAVALHLAEAVAEGVEQAILFAANPAASRAYEAIGFARMGAYRIVNFDPVVLVGEVS